MKTKIHCVAVAIVITTLAAVITKHSSTSESDVSGHPQSKKTNKKYLEGNSPNFTERISPNSKEFYKYLNSWKKINGICKAKFEGGSKLDVENVRYDNRRTKLLLTRAKVIKKMLLFFWFLLFLLTVFFLVTFMFQLATSGSTEWFLINQTKVQIVLFIASYLISSLTAFKQEWEFGGMRFTTTEFITNFLGVANACYITAMAFGLHRIFC